MKTLFTFLAILTLSGNLKAQEFAFEPAGQKQTTIGIILKKGETWVLREGEGNHIIDYYPVNLDPTYQIDGQEVVFEGVLGKNPASVRLPGRPIKLTMIRKLYRAQPKEVTNDMTADKKATPAEIILTNQKATITYLAETWLLIDSTNGKLTRYVPESLPADFKIEGLQVTFSGVAQQPDPSVRAMGQFLTITDMTAVVEKKVQQQELQEAMKDFYPFEVVGRIEVKEGVIKKFSTDPDTYIFETDNGTRRYLPAYLPEEFKVHLKRVVVTGNYGAIPPQVRMAGTPFEIEWIEPVN